jgi:starch synthase
VSAPAGASEGGAAFSGQVRLEGPSPLVLWLVAEAFPWAHTGGLGDVAASLPRVLRTHGWDVRLCLPLYRSARRHGIGPPLASFDVALGLGVRVPCAIRPALDPPGGVPVYFIDCELFDRPGVYGEGGAGYADNPFRFGVWQLAVRALVAKLDPTPALIHCHDWHAALMPVLAKLPGPWPGGRGQGSDGDVRDVTDIRTVLTVHNLEFQGVAGRSLLAELALPPDVWHPEWLEHFGAVNLLKGGILSADLVTTVSRTYAVEIRTPGGGMGLDGPLADRGSDLVGIVNGIDVVAFDPATDPALPAHFDVVHRAGRARVKAALRDELGISGGPEDLLLGFVGRITETKGVDLLVDALPGLFALGAKVVILGSGDPALEERLRQAASVYPDRLRVELDFDHGLARRIYGGADMLLVPSRAEPCGLVQLYALRYGAVPVVRAVGGLEDTVADGKTGFKFHRADPEALVAAVARAAAVFADPVSWAAMMHAGMSQDWSWQASAAGYDALYRRALARAPRRRPLAVPEDDQPLLVDWGPDLPPRLATRRLQLMVQGPGCLYAYWESPEGDLELVLEEQPTALAFLLTSACADIGDAWIPALPEHAYRATLQRRDGTIVLRSNLVLTPRAEPVGDDEDELPPWLGRLLALDPERRAALGGAEAVGLFATPPRLVAARRQWDGRVTSAPLPPGPPLLPPRGHGGAGAAGPGGASDAMWWSGAGTGADTGAGTGAGTETGARTGAGTEGEELP